MIQAKFRGTLSFLSNFYPVNVFGYPSAEHAYQAMKFPQGSPHRLNIGHLTAGQAKRYARDHQRDQRPLDDWARRYLMQDILAAKFAPGSELATKLMALNPNDLVEENTWHDLNWGVCICPTHNGAGRNWLGTALLYTRNDLYAQQILADDKEQ